MAVTVARPSPTQVIIMRNIRDDGDPFFGRHGSPRGQQQHGGWQGALIAAERRRWVSARDGWALTEAGRAALEGQSTGA